MTIKTPCSCIIALFGTDTNNGNQIHVCIVHVHVHDVIGDVHVYDNQDTYHLPVFITLFGTDTNKWKSNMYIHVEHELINI